MGDRTDLVVERLEDQGVAGGFEVGGAEEVGGLGVGEGDVPAGPATVFAVLVVLGVIPGDGLGDEAVDDDRPAGGAVGELFVDPDRGRLGEAVGLAGDPAGLPGRHLEPAEAFPEHRGRWRRSRASAISCAPADGDMPNANANGSGVNAATSGVPSPPNDSSASRAAPPKVSTPVSAVAGWRSAQWAASWSLRNSRSRSSCSLAAASSSTATGSRSPTSYRSRTVVLMGLSQASTTDTRGRESPVSTGVSDRDLLVIWTAPGWTTICSVLASLPSCPWEEDSSWPWSRRASSPTACTSSSSEPEAQPTTSAPTPTDTPTATPTPTETAMPEPGEQADLDARLSRAAWDNDVDRARRLIARGADVNAKDDTSRAPTSSRPARATSTCSSSPCATAPTSTTRTASTAPALIRAAERGHADVVGPAAAGRRSTSTTSTASAGPRCTRRSSSATAREPTSTPCACWSPAGADVGSPSPRDGADAARSMPQRGLRRSRDPAPEAAAARTATRRPADAGGGCSTAARPATPTRLALALRAGRRPRGARRRDRRLPCCSPSTHDHVDVARLLVALGADPDALDDRHDTPWLVTGVTGSVAMLEALLPADPDLTIRNRFGGVSVIPASERGHVDYVRRVVQTDIDVNHVNDLGWTALLEAVILGDGSAPPGDRPDPPRRRRRPAIADGDGVTALEHARYRAARPRSPGSWPPVSSGRAELGHPLEHGPSVLRGTAAQAAGRGDHDLAGEVPPRSRRGWSAGRRSTATRGRTRRRSACPPGRRGPASGP